ncbi:MAG: hypothetical protein ACJATN_000286 [Neolewinella sp.]|jgi:hypothetical protein
MLSEIKKDERFENKKKQEYRVVNWPEYNKALENRDNITFIFDDEIVQN